VKVRTKHSERSKDVSLEFSRGFGHPDIFCNPDLFRLLNKSLDSPGMEPEGKMLWTQGQWGWELSLMEGTLGLEIFSESQMLFFNNLNKV
jgi:hypothetical protein